MHILNSEIRNMNTDGVCQSSLSLVIEQYTVLAFLLNGRRDERDAKNQFVLKVLHL